GGPLAVELGGQEEAGAADGGDPGQGGQLLTEAPAGPAGPGGDVLLLHHRQGGPGGGHRQGLAPEGGGVVAGPEGGGDLGGGPTGPHRHAVAEGLGHGDDVGPEVLGVEGE